MTIDELREFLSREGRHAWCPELELQGVLEEADALRARVTELEAEREKVLNALEEMVHQHCGIMDHSGKDKPGLDSYAITANAEAMFILDEYGRLEITAEGGRRVLAVPKEKESR